jgi:hypothetical protein
MILIVAIAVAGINSVPTFRTPRRVHDALQVIVRRADTTGEDHGFVLDGLGFGQVFISS